MDLFRGLVAGGLFFATSIALLDVIVYATSGVSFIDNLLGI